MEESATYQAIIHKGAIRELRKTILLLGEKLFKAPPPVDVIEALYSDQDLDRLERLSVRLVEVSSWSELLVKPQPPPEPQGRTRRRKAPP
jgi:hypothetical protein